MDVFLYMFNCFYIPVIMCGICIYIYVCTYIYIYIYICIYIYMYIYICIYIYVYIYIVSVIDLTVKYGCLLNHAFPWDIEIPKTHICLCQSPVP